MRLALIVAVAIAMRLVLIDATQATDPSNPAGLPGLVAAGAVKYTLDVGGLPEAEAVLREFDKPGEWNQNPRTICDVRRASMAAAQQRFEQFFLPEMETFRNARP